ncbi:MAG: hypothetical protein BroJett011_45680 [Chloroflexota bacterium]|nr:MAG: hypothetical protein BroJett011_45680 [Chloroflexota bacterium]
MTEFNLEILLDQLAELSPKATQRLSLTELEWVLSDWVRGWEQQLLQNSVTCPDVTSRERVREFGFVYLPCFIAADFPLVSIDQTRRLALAGASGALYALLLDHIIDNPLTAPVSLKLAGDHLLFHSWQLLSELFPTASLFWDEFKHCMYLMSQAMLEEQQRHFGAVRPFSLAEFKQIAHGKMALAQLNWIGMAILSNRPEYIPTLIQCWNAIGLAEVICDDVLDWREDYENANYTYLLSQILLASPFQKEIDAGHLPETAEVGAALFCSDKVEALYLLAYEDLRIAQEQALNINCPALAGVIDTFKTKTGAWPTELFKRKMATLLTIHQYKSINDGG